MNPGSSVRSPRSMTCELRGAGGASRPVPAYTIDEPSTWTSASRTGAAPVPSIKRAALTTCIVALRLQPGVFVDGHQFTGVDQRIVQFGAVSGGLVARHAPDAW